MQSAFDVAFTPYVLPLIASAAVTLGLGLYALLRRRIAGAGSFAICMFAVVEWSLAYAMELAALDIQGKTFWYQAVYFGVAPIPACWLVFALKYSQWQRWLRPRTYVVLAVVPAVLLVIVWTNPVHGLMWPTLSMDQLEEPSVLRQTFGPAYWFNTLYSYLLVMGGTTILLVRLLRAGRLYGRQAVALALASIAPVVGSLLYTLNLSGRYDPAPFTFTITGAALFWGFLRYGLLDVLPVARSAVFDAMTDGILVVDGVGRVVDLNKGALALLGLSADAGLGQPTELLLPGIDTAHDGLRTEISVGDGRRLEVQVSALHHGNGELAGHLVLLRDISALRLSEERFRAQYQNLPVPTYSWQVQNGSLVLVDLNVAADTTLPGRAGRILGKSIDEVLVDRPDIRADVERCVREKRSFRREITGETAAGGRMLDLTFAWVPPDLVMLHMEDITERKQAEHLLTHRALHDALTDLPNRHMLNQRLQAALGDATAGVGPALLLLDLDRFKEVNDTLGHNAGDLLLSQVAMRLRSAMPQEVTVARLGGDEFAVLLPNATEDDAVALAGVALDILARPIQIEGSALDVGGSIGIALAPQHGGSPDVLLRHADVAMYVAKRSGAGYAVYAEDLDDSRPDRLALVSELRQAIRDGALELHYQPIVSTADCEVRGVEALVRWPHPRRGLVPPGEFIALAERTGLITSLSRWVLREAVRQQRAWRDAGIQHPVAVNLSMHDLQDASLPELVAGLLAESNVPAQALAIELTESSLMADPNRARAALSRLRDLGVRLVVDDFGTGYSSLAYLKQLPVQELKIDRSFVSDVHRGGTDLALVESIIDLAHKLGLQVVAEGVEDAETHAHLARLGCDLAQGYYFGRPAPAALIAPQPLRRAA